MLLNCALFMQEEQAMFAGSRDFILFGILIVRAGQLTGHGPGTGDGCSGI